MNAIEFFQLGNKYQSQGRSDLAMQMWNEAVSTDPVFSPSYLNIAQINQKEGNVQGAIKALESFLDRPLTGRTIDLLPRVKADIENMKKSLQPPEKK